MDRRLARHNDTPFLYHRHFARSSACVAARTSLDAVANAAALGVACDPVLFARADPDLPAGLPAAAVADLRRLLRRCCSGAQLAFRLGCVSARAIARALDHSGLDRGLG